MVKLNMIILNCNLLVMLVMAVLFLGNIAVSAAAESAGSLKDGQVIDVWPGVAPGSEGLTLKEEVIERSKEPEKIKDRVVAKILNPTLTAYQPPKPNGAAILIASKDNTHLRYEEALEVARLVVGIKENNLPLAEYIK